MQNYKIIIFLLLLPLFLNAHTKTRTLLDPEIQIDEILPPGVVPIGEPTVQPSLSSTVFGAVAQGIFPSLAIGYSAATAYLFYLSYNINKKNSWAHWYHTSIAKDENELAQHLFTAIKQKYIQNSANFL